LFVRTTIARLGGYEGRKRDDMTIREILKSKGYADYEVRRGNLDFVPEHGYDIKTRVIRPTYFKEVTMVEIFPYVPYTDGGYRPCYGGAWSASRNNTAVYLNNN